MTVNEYLAAVDGFLESRGVSTAPTGMTRRRLDELKRMFPDKPKADP